jgi:hypothetical protein
VVSVLRQCGRHCTTPARTACGRSHSIMLQLFFRPHERLRRSWGRKRKNLGRGTQRVPGLSRTLTAPQPYHKVLMPRSSVASPKRCRSPNHAQRLAYLAEVVGGMDHDCQRAAELILTLPGRKALDQRGDALVARSQALLEGTVFPSIYCCSTSR